MSLKSVLFMSLSSVSSRTSLSFVVLVLGSFGGMSSATAGCASVGGELFASSPNSGSALVLPDLVKYGVPARECTTLTFPGNDTHMVLDTTMAVAHKNFKVANCPGLEFELNGGIVHSYMHSEGLAYPEGSGFLTSDQRGVVYTQVDNLSVTVNNQSFVLSTDVLAFPADVKVRFGQTTQYDLCIPNGAVAAKLNGTPINIPLNLWQCLMQNQHGQVIKVNYKSC